MTAVRQVENYMDVMFCFPPKVRYFAQVEAAGGTLLGAYDEAGIPVGIVCLKTMRYAYDTVYLYVNEQNRRQGIAKSLMRRAADIAKGEGKTLRLRALQNSKSRSAVLKIAQGMDMCLDEEMTFFRLNVNVKSKELWEEARPKIMQMVERVDKKRGAHQVIAFEDADEKLIGQLREMIGTSLPGLDPFALPEFDPHFSLIILHGGEIAAVNAVRTIGRKMVYEISSARKNSTIIAGVPVFFDRLFASEIELVSCVVRDDNPAGLNHAGKRFGFLFKESGRQSVYIL
ncbi:MAG: GNAT family N-acetyltransferase [Oscillospiraceae bacterium]|nr:GNAT family N-acetyltransferase [Oscillospiraceae bacterium]